MSLLLNLLGPREGFEGGLFLPDFKQATSRRPIENVVARDPLRVPLQVSRTMPTKPEVAVGDSVLRGQRIAALVGTASVSVHAPTSGRVVEIDRVWTAREGFLPCAVIEPDGRDTAAPCNRTWSEESMVLQLAEHGVIVPAPLMPAHELIRQATQAGVTDLIVSAMETEPYLTSDLRTLVEQHGRFLDMTGELADALGVHHVYFALPYRHRRVVKRVCAEAAGRHIEISPLSDRYPQCQPNLLVKTILDREVPPGGTPLDVEAVVVPLTTIRMAADAVLSDRPVTHAIVTVAGDAVEHAGTYRVPIGTSVRQLADRVGLLAPVRQAVWGGPLTGIALTRDETVITADTAAILLFSQVHATNPVPCIRCGWCVEDCPVGLDPAALVQLEPASSADEQTKAHLKTCLDCGLCSYVCPATLPLAATIHRARERFCTTSSHSSGGA